MKSSRRSQNPMTGRGRDFSSKGPKSRSKGGGGGGRPAEEVSGSPPGTERCWENASHRQKCLTNEKGGDFKKKNTSTGKGRQEGRPGSSGTKKAVCGKNLK